MPPRIEVRTKLRVFSRTKSMRMAAGTTVAGQTRVNGYDTNASNWYRRAIQAARNRHNAVYVAPSGSRNASQAMYWIADGMMIVAKGVNIGHHCRSFQSTQKSQSPANSSLVRSPAAAITNAADTKKTMSHLRSIYTYCRLSTARSS